ncbi:hypothetical protein Y032_0239g3313 [Ancylostoma ceylanicum]|uniref:Uncharacterized protein n=1 Tax=Ancylostoma ceylanicum TaxID=53326 RepID=A0A016SEX8_9BILA|nr:hypothetical protein Y032_0239g3313 [Ancylostoma ceylanicum]
MAKSKRKKIMNDKIPSKPKASISETMRKEREMEGEVFENVKTAVTPTASTRTLRSTSSLRRMKKKSEPVTILPAEPPIEFQNDILSVYSQVSANANHIRQFIPDDLIVCRHGISTCE